MSYSRLRWAIFLLILLMGTTAVSISATISTSLSLDWIFTGDEDGEAFGTAVAHAGDVNGDGFADILIGAPKDSSFSYRAGSAFVFHGASGGTVASPNWSASSDLQGSDFGFAVASAGDINNDGYDDVVIGAPQYKNGESHEGRVTVFLGSSSGLQTTPHRHLEINLKEAQFGYAVSGAGDVNKDGFDDVLIGANWYENGEATEGAVFLYLGSATGLAETAVWQYQSNETGANLGTAVAGGGDVNNDGYADILVGAPHMDHAETADTGAVLLFLGGETGLAAQPDWIVYGPHTDSLFGNSIAFAGDTNQDNYTDMLVGVPHFNNGETDEGGAFLFMGGTQPAQTAVWQMQANQTNALMGTAVSSAGDVNNDGYDDILIGTAQFTLDQNQEGRVSLYLGTPTGPALLPVWQSYGDKAETQFGSSVSAAGDTNGDGYDDILVGAPLFRINRDLVGKSFLFLGTDITVDQHSVYLPMIVR
jgi:hypothetical protein